MYIHVHYTLQHDIVRIIIQALPKPKLSMNKRTHWTNWQVAPRPLTPHCSCTTSQHPWAPQEVQAATAMVVRLQFNPSPTSTPRWLLWQSSSRESQYLERSRMQMPSSSERYATCPRKTSPQREKKRGSSKHLPRQKTVSVRFLVEVDQMIPYWTDNIF